MEKQAEKKKMSDKAKVNPLTNERVFVRFVPRNTGFSSDLKSHPVYGGKADGTTTTLVVPILRSTGHYKNILTDSEKDFLEEALGLDSNALSVYRTQNNYWDNYKVVIPKEGFYLDLSNPEDFIKYKVLLANTDIIAPSVKERVDRPKATYQFELVREKEETMLENAKIDATMASYKEFGKIENDVDTMRVVVELLDGRPYNINSGATFFRSRIGMLITDDAKKFLSTVTDPMLHTKVIIRRSVELGKLTKRGDYYYLTSDGSPLCEKDENPTLSIAARFLNLPANQEIKYILESEVDKNRV